jgi:hypothetical protein
MEAAWRWLALIALGAAGIALLWNVGRYLIGANCAITFPFGLDYGEGIVWEQMRLIGAGRGYGPIDGFPAIVFHYPPLYHLGAALIAGSTGIDELAAGRLLSVTSTVAMAAFMGAIVFRLAKHDAAKVPALIGGGLTALMTFSLVPIQIWSLLMRVDMPSFAFGFAGFYFGLRAITQPRAVYLSALFFVAAIYTKQTAVAAPAAAFLVLLAVRPRTAWAGIIATIAGGLVVLATLSWLTQGEFMRHLVLYNINRFAIGGLDEVVRTFRSHILYIAIALAGLLSVLGDLRPLGLHRRSGWKHLCERLGTSPGLAARTMLLLYGLFASIMLLMTMKSGASYNYMIEWCCVMLLFAGLALSRTASLAADGSAAGASKGLLLVLPVAALLQAQMLFGISAARCNSQVAKSRELNRLAALVRAAPGPVISDDMVTIMRGGKDVIWEPAIFAELINIGRWDERPLLARIKARKFAFFITDGKPGDPIFDDRYSPAIARAIRTTYPVERLLAGRHVRFPAGPLPAYAADLR